MAADLLETYQDNLGQLSETGVKKFTRERYNLICVTFGLPSAPTDKVCSLVWERVVKTVGDSSSEPKVEPFYG